MRVNASDADLIRRVTGFRQCLVCGAEFAGSGEMTRCSNCQASRAESIAANRDRLGLLRAAHGVDPDQCGVLLSQGHISRWPGI
jgi:hypothetical protein